MSDTINLTRRQRHQFAELAGASSLRDCTDVTETTHGTTVLTKRFDCLSDGEQVLWDTLADLLAGRTPDQSEYYRLDSVNLPIAQRAIASVFGAPA